MNYRKIIVFDFETDLPDPFKCNAVQLAAVAVNPRRLEIVPNSEFNVVIKPPNIDDEDYMTTDRKQTIMWHANLRGITPEEVVAGWKEGTLEEHAWKDFVNYVNGYNPKGTFFTAPIAGGANIKDFDLIIADRLNKRYKITKDLFWKRDRADVLEYSYHWFEGLADAPKNYKMDTLREFFGMSSENAHDALTDVKDSANILIRFMKLHRHFAPKVTWNVN